MLREDWIKKIEASGGKQPVYAHPSSALERLSKLDFIHVYWSEKLPNYQKIRNQVAKDMRRDGWEVKSYSAVCEGGHNCALLKAERPKQA